MKNIIGKSLVLLLWAALPGSLSGIDMALAEDGQPHGVCIVNGSAQSMFSVAEARSGMRVAQWLKPGAKLCSPALSASAGVVSVFPSEDVQEGCSRLAGTDMSETLLEYVDIDRCRWASLN